MKTFFYILFILCLPFAVVAQGNLQFNQTKLIENYFSVNVINPSGTYHTYIIDSFSIVVPANKTLKIENIASSPISDFKIINPSTGLPVITVPNKPVCNIIMQYNVMLNNTIAYVYSNDYPSSPSLRGIPDFPIWLPPGTHKISVTWSGAYINNDPAAQNYPYKIKINISAIEFNIIP